MPLSEQEKINIHTDMALMKKSLDDFTQAQIENSKSQSRTNDKLTEVLKLMGEQAIEKKYIADMYAEDKKQTNLRLDAMEKNQVKAMEQFLPVITRTKKWHVRVDKVYDTWSTTAGKTIWYSFAAGAIYLIGKSLKLNLPQYLNW